MSGKDIQHGGVVVQRAGVGVPTVCGHSEQLVCVATGVAASANPALPARYMVCLGAAPIRQGTQPLLMHALPAPDAADSCSQPSPHPPGSQTCRPSCAHSIACGCIIHDYPLCQVYVLDENTSIRPDSVRASRNPERHGQNIQKQPKKQPWKPGRQPSAGWFTQQLKEVLDVETGGP